MWRRLAGRAVWIIAVAAVLNGLAGLCLAGLRFIGVIGGSWTAVLAPLWVPVLLATLLEVILLHIIWTSTSNPPVQGKRDFSEPLASSGSADRRAR